MKKVIFPLLLMVISHNVYADWTSTIKIDPLTDTKEGIASTRPSDKTELSVICKAGEVPQLAITWLIKKT